MPTTSLPEVLRALRTAKGASLRDVEKATRVSNAYVSQLERGEATKPSADKLYALAKFYDVPYQNLLAAAGYIEENKEENTSASALQNALMAYHLSPEEESLVMKFIETIKSK